MDAAKLERSVTRLLTLLARCDYGALKRLDRVDRLSEESLAQAVADYGRTIVLPPSYPADIIDIVPVAGASPRAWCVNVPIWTEEEGRSDLTLSVTLVDSADQLYGVELDDLHVL
jgi:hypothetical protein